jgi:hypothetical protein
LKGNDETKTEMSGAINAQVRRQNQFSGDRPLKLTTYRDSEIDEKTIQLLKVSLEGPRIILEGPSLMAVQGKPLRPSTHRRSR